MASKKITIERFNITSAKPFGGSQLDFSTGRSSRHHAILFSGSSANDDEELQSLVKSPVGPTDLMEFLRLDHGGVLRRELGPAAPNVIRLLIGNPVAAWVPAINACLPWRLTLRLFGLLATGPSLPTSGRSAVADRQARWATQLSA